MILTVRGDVPLRQHFATDLLPHCTAVVHTLCCHALTQSHTHSSPPSYSFISRVAAVPLLLSPADGDIDAVFLTQTSVEWLENVGGPLLFSPVSHVISNAVTNLVFFMMDSLSLIDYNRDGRMDVCVISQADRVGKISVFTNMGPAREFVFGSEELVVSSVAFNVNASAIVDMDMVRGVMIMRGIVFCCVTMLHSAFPVTRAAVFPPRVPSRVAKQDGWPDIVYVDNANVGWYRNTGTPGAWFNSTPIVIYAGGPSKSLIGLGALWILPILNATSLAVGTWQGVMVLSTVPGTRQWTQPPVVVSNVNNSVLCLASGDVNNDGTEVRRSVTSCHEMMMVLATDVGRSFARVVTLCMASLCVSMRGRCRNCLMPVGVCLLCYLLSLLCFLSYPGPCDCVNRWHHLDQRHRRCNCKRHHQPVRPTHRDQSGVDFWSDLRHPRRCGKRR